MIETQNLTKHFGDILAVDNLTLSIPPGQVFGFLGPNGAGKTTTVRMLATLIGPTSGTATVAGYALDGEEQSIRRHVGILTETPGLYERLSAARNLEIFANLYEVEDVAGQVEKFLRMLGLWERRQETAGTFSKGMKQKLAIARALLHEPQVLFLDEPTAGLDPEASRLVRDFVSELRAEGRTIFITTHNLDEAERLCDRIAVFNQRLRVVDSPVGLRRRLYGRQVVFHLGDGAQRFVDVLAGSPAVKHVDAVDNKLVAAVAEPEAANPELIRALVAAGADIQFVGEIRHSLEEIYLQLVNAEEVVP
ncbi:MAG: ABC transporter ATP-binding protein [Anaerolineae bacterium]|nr:ABC transporter ATP-binding protein [Anaerolineae bacterium]